MPSADTNATTTLEKPAEAVSEMCVVDLGEHTQEGDQAAAPR